MRFRWLVTLVIWISGVITGMGIGNLITKDQIASKVAELQRQNAALVRDIARWEDIAKRFEQLNHDCLEITFGRQP